MLKKVVNYTLLIRLYFFEFFFLRIGIRDADKIVTAYDVLYSKK